MGPLRRLLAWNQSVSARLCAWVERRTGRRNGMFAFRDDVLPSLLRAGLRVLDVGGGKWPMLDVATKRRLGLHVTGLDISADELAQAPPGAYDATVVGDVASVCLPGRYDLIVSHTVLEHVRDTPAAIANLAAALDPGGSMAHFVPCANAGYTVISRLLGHRVGRTVLWAVYPESRATSGFPAYYNRCTPRKMRGLCESAGLAVSRVDRYFASEYFRFCLPLYCLELLRQLTLMWAGAGGLCETFTIVAGKPPAAGARRRAA